MIFSDLHNFVLNGGRWPVATRKFSSLHDEMSRLLNSFDSEVATFNHPSLDVATDNDKVVVTAELPGIDLKDLDLTVEGRQLSIKGSRSEVKASNLKWIRRERSFGEFERKISLPYTVETEKVEASYKNGVLTVTLPRAEKDKPKKINIS